MNSCHFGNICSLLLFLFFFFFILIPGHLFCMNQTHIPNFSLQLTETMPAEKMNKEYSVFMIPLPPAAKYPAMRKLKLAPYSLYVVDLWISEVGATPWKGREGPSLAQQPTSISCQRKSILCAVVMHGQPRL